MRKLLERFWKEDSKPGQSINAGFFLLRLSRHLAPSSLSYLFLLSSYVSTTFDSHVEFSLKFSNPSSFRQLCWLSLLFDHFTCPCNEICQTWTSFLELFHSCFTLPNHNICISDNLLHCAYTIASFLSYQNNCDKVVAYIS